MPKPTSALCGICVSHLIYAGENEAAHCSAIVVAKYAQKFAFVEWGEQGIALNISYISPVARPIFLGWILLGNRQFALQLQHYIPGITSASSEQRLDGAGFTAAVQMVQL